MARYVFAACALILGAVAGTPAARPPAEAALSTMLLSAVDREFILSNTFVSGAICLDGGYSMLIRNPWPYAYGESVARRGDEWTTVEENGTNWSQIYHQPAPCPDRTTTTWRPGAYHTAQEFRGTSIYTFAPKPSALGFDPLPTTQYPPDDPLHPVPYQPRDPNLDGNWAFPIGADEASAAHRFPVPEALAQQFGIGSSVALIEDIFVGPYNWRNTTVKGLAFCSGWQNPAWGEPALATLNDQGPRAVDACFEYATRSDATRFAGAPRPRPDAFARCRQSGERNACWGFWGPQDGSYPRSGWMPDGSLASVYLRILYGAALADDRHPGRLANGYQLVPNVRPYVGHWVQRVYPYPPIDGPIPIGSGPVVFDPAERGDPDGINLRRPPHGPATGVILYGYFQRACGLTYLLGPSDAPRD